MICPRCARAADARAPREQHCADPKCMCAHRTDRYDTVTARSMATGLFAPVTINAQALSRLTIPYLTTTEG